jgi:hypothetical protein
MMAHSECYCPQRSCESITIRNPQADQTIEPIRGEDGKWIDDRFMVSIGTRFMFVKDEKGRITDRVTIDGVEYKGGITTPDIPHCRELHKGEWAESLVELESKLKEPHLSNKARRKMERAKKFGRV